VAGYGLKYEGDDGHGRPPQLRFPEVHSSRLVVVGALGHGRSLSVREVVIGTSVVQVVLFFTSLPPMVC
jgi:hypothetical protein